jgi:DNA polymerase III epsilon subunit-like protein
MKIQVASLAIAICLCLCLCLSKALGAYELPLDARVLHEAWELGQRNDQETGNFLAHYLKKISGGENDPYTAEIEILTYAQVVDQSRQKTTSYSEDQAALDYHQRGNTILINLVIMLPAAYPRTGAETNPPAENNRVVRP